MTTLESDLRRFEALERSRGASRESVAAFRVARAEFSAFLAGRGKPDLREATTDDVAAYLQELERVRGLGAKTVSMRLWRLRKQLDFLKKSGRMLWNPARAIHRGRSPYRLREGLTEAEVHRLLRQPDTGSPFGVRDRAIVEVLYSTGLRLGELRALELDDLDLEEGWVEVRQSKSGHGRRVPMGRHACRWTRRYLEEVRPKLLQKPRLEVFLSQAGTPIDAGGTNARLKSYGKPAELARPLSAHLLRHTFAIHLLQNGASIRHVQAMLGHLTLSSTQLYTNLLPWDLKRVHRKAHPRENGRLPE